MFYLFYLSKFMYCSDLSPSWLNVFASSFDLILFFSLIVFFVVILVEWGGRNKNRILLHIHRLFFPHSLTTKTSVLQVLSSTMDSRFGFFMIFVILDVSFVSIGDTILGEILLIIVLSAILSRCRVIDYHFVLILLLLTFILSSV